MPHITIECSPGVQDRLDAADLLRLVHETVVSMHFCAPEALRLRLYASSRWLVGGGAGGSEAVHLAIEAKKRPPEERRRIVSGLHAVLADYLTGHLSGTPCLISVDIRDLDESYLTGRI